MNEFEGGSPNFGGLVPILIGGKSHICSWIKNCDVRCIAAKMKFSDLKGPLATAVFNGTSEEGENDGLTYLKIVSEDWTINVALHHCPQGSAVPNTLNLPFDVRDGVARRGGDGAYVSWSDGNHQSIRLFSVRRPSEKDKKFWQLVRCMNTACKAMGSVIADELVSGETESQPRGPTLGEGELRAAAQAAQAAQAEQAAQAARQAEATQPAATSTRLHVIRPGEALEYCGTVYKFRGEKRWEIVMKLADGNGQYVHCGKGLKGYFSKDKEARAFFDAAIEAEAAGRGGTMRYKLRV